MTFRFFIRGITLLLLAVGAVRLNATELQPWLGNIYEFEWRNDLLYQNYASISSGSHLKHKAANDLFFRTSLCNAVPDFGLEAEMILARTCFQKGSVDQLKVTGRYVWEDDIAGDPLSIVTGVSLIKAFWPSLRDISSFHHGLGEMEVFLSFGKEISCKTIWISRWWGVVGMGWAERGSPWFRIDGAYEVRVKENHIGKFFVETLWGLGPHRLNPHHFHGYGSIQHQSVDVGLKYEHLIEFVGSASLSYSYRVYAFNFPAYSHRVQLEFLYTFGL